MKLGVLAVMVSAGKAFCLPLGAQCASNASSCATCDETQGLRPVLQSAQPWHADRGFGEGRTACFGGEPSALSRPGALGRIVLSSALDASPWPGPLVFAQAVEPLLVLPGRAGRKAS